MAGEEPPFLSVGTDVSAKYKGAFCEAKIKKVTRSVKCKVTFKNNQGSALITDDQVKGNLRVGAHVEAKHPEKNQYLDAIINKLHDYSQYTVVFDDGDETTLRRTSLCLKSGRHFAESETLDQLPLTHPEHFGTPVMGCKGRKRRSRHRSPTLGELSSDEEPPPKKKEYVPKEPDPHMGKVVCVELGDKKKQKDNWFPALIVSTSAQDNMKVKKDEYMVRSFKDGKYFVVFKKDVRDFTHEIGNRVDNNTLKTAVERAMQYIEKDDLPPHWDRDLLFGAAGSSVEENTEQDSDSDSSDDEPSEEKDRFVAQLYKFMDDRGTPINKAPIVCSRDLNLYRLFKVVQKIGGYNRVTNQSQWKAVYGKMGLPLSNATSSQQMKQAYKKYLHSFEDFYRKLGCTMSTTTRSGRMRHRSGRNIIMTRDRNRELKAAGRKSSHVDVTKVKKEKDEGEKKSVKEEPAEASLKLKEKPQENIPAEDAQDKQPESVENSTIEDLASNEEMPDKMEKPAESKIMPQSVVEPEASTSSSEKDNETELEDEDKDMDRIQLRKAAHRERRDKMDDEEFKVGDDEDTKSEDSPKRRGRKKMIKPDDKKRDESDDKSQGSDDESDFEHTVIDMDIAINHRVKVKYGRGKQQKIYEAKVLKIDEDDGGRLFFVHYTGWNMRYDEWVKRHRIVANLTQKLSEKKGRAAAAAAAAKSGKPPAKRGRPVGSTSAKTLAGLTKSPGSLAKSRITRSDKSSPLVNGLELRKRSRKASLVADTSNDQQRGEDSDDCGEDDDSEKREMASESQDALESETDTQVSKESKDKEDFEEKTSEDVTGKDEEDQERPAKIRKTRKVKAKLEASDDDDDDDEVLPSTSGIDAKLEKKNARRGRVGRPRTVNRDSDTRDEDADVDEEAEEVMTKPKKKGRKPKATPERESPSDPICQDTSEQGDTEDNVNESKEETEGDDVSHDPSLEIKDNSTTMDTNNDCGDECQQTSEDTKLPLEADTAKLPEDVHEEPIRDTFTVETTSECDVEESKEILDVANETTTTPTEEEALGSVAQLPGDVEKAIEDDDSSVSRQHDSEICSDAADVQEELTVVKDEVDIPDKELGEPIEVAPLVEEVSESVSNIKTDENEQTVVPKPEDFIVTVPCEQEFTEDICQKPSEHDEIKPEIAIAEDVLPMVTPKPEDCPTTSDITPVECITSSQTEPSKDSDSDVVQSLESGSIINTETEDMIANIAVEPSFDAEKSPADADSSDVQLLEKLPPSVSKKEKKLKQKSKKSDKKRDSDAVLHQSPNEAEPEVEDEGCASTEDDLKVVKKKHKEGKASGKSEEKSSGVKNLSKKLKERKSASSSSSSKSRKDGDESRKDESKQKEKKKKREGDKVRKEKTDISNIKPDGSSKTQSEDKDIAEDDASSDGASGQKKEKKKKQKGTRDDDGEPKKKSKKKSIKPEVSVDDPKQTPVDERIASEDAVPVTAHTVAPMHVPSKDKDAKKAKKGERSEKSKRRKEKSTPTRKETPSAEEEESDEKPAVTPTEMTCHNIDIPETSESPKETNMESDISSYLLCKEEVPASPPPPAASPPPPPPTNATTMGSLTLMSLSVCVSTATTVANSSASATCAATNNQVFQSPSKHESEPIGVLDNTPPTTPDSSLPTSTSDGSSCSPLTSPARIASSDTPGEQEQEAERDEVHQTAAVPSFSDDGVARTMLKCSVDSSGNSSSSHSCSPDPISDLRQLSEAAETKRSLVDTAVDVIPLKKRRKNHRRHHHSVSSSAGASSPAPVRQRHGSSRSPRSAVSDEESQENVLLPCLPLQSTAAAEHEIASSAQPRSPRPSRFNFYVELDDYSDGAERIAVIQDRLKELRKTYMALKAEVACLDRRRKKLKRKEKESSCLPSSSATEVECS